MSMDLKNKKILILGAGYQQIPLIRRAKKRKAFVVVCDISSNSPGISDADLHIKCDIHDQKKIITVIKDLKLDAILTIGTDQAMVCVSQVAYECGLPCHLLPQAAKYATNKELMSSRFDKFHVKTPKSFAVTKELDNPRLDELSFPLVVKPIAGQGQKGIRRANNLSELQNAIEHAKNYNILEQDAGVIIEEFFEGSEITLSAWLCNGSILWVGAADRITFNPLPAIGIAFQHIAPSLQAAKISNDLNKTLLKVAKAYGMKNGPLYAQIIVEKNEHRVIEVGARIGGGNEYFLYKYSTGIDLADASLNLALNLPVDYIFEQREIICNHALVNFIFAHEGKIEKQTNLADLKKKDKILNGDWYKIKGDYQEPIVDAYGRVGWFLMGADNRKSLLRSSKSFYETLQMTSSKNEQILFWPDQMIND
ncbi:ATP-grasp domain-containing protein [Alphaproteobacteria bacterium]|nr:ATP-grasp domain-containing protein [Alphaproteobacteria bacterium]